MRINYIAVDWREVDQIDVPCHIFWVIGLYDVFTIKITRLVFFLRSLPFDKYSYKSISKEARAQ